MVFARPGGSSAVHVFLISLHDVTCFAYVVSAAFEFQDVHGCRHYLGNWVGVEGGSTFLVESVIRGTNLKVCPSQKGLAQT